MSTNNAQIPEVLTMGPGEYDEVLALWTRAGLPARPEGRDAPEAFRRQHEAGLQRAIGMRDDGKIVAVAILTHDGRKGWINRLAVDPAYRRRGYASVLIAEAERWFRDEIGLEVFSALIHSHNDLSRALFAELGYETVDVVYVRKLARPGA
ncbi:MAG: GNAT family N-acetyltransferase [Nitrososphaerales archaeon]